MTPEYILKKSLCRQAHCYSAHVPGKGYVNDGSQVDTRADYDRQRAQHAASEIDNMGYAPEYAELGYTQPVKGILFANWNVFPRGIDTILERYGYAVEWGDEWTTCSDCGRAVRTSPDCYSWQASYIIQNECELVCLDCVDWPDYLQSIEDDPDVACMAACNPADYGYQRLSESSEYESGFHPGQNDKPADVLKALHATGRRNIVFRVSKTSQFYSCFETWQRIEEED